MKFTPSPKQRINAQIARIAKAVSSASRLELLELLGQGERSVEVLAGTAGLTVANTSQHLQALRRVGLVTARKEGLFVHYQLSDLDVVRLLLLLRRISKHRLVEMDQLVAEFFTSRDRLEAVPREELLARIRAGTVTVLDVRPPEEYHAGHISGALSVPLNRLAHAGRRLPADREVVAYCRGPYCLLAVEAVEWLRRHGRRARRLEDGFPEWLAAGLPVTSEDAA